MEVERVRVQAISSSSLSNNTIPAEFIRPEKEQPAATTFRGGAAPEIPTIDLSDPDEEKLVRLIASASKEWGIFQVVNHGIPAEVVRKLQSAGEEFFGLPAEEKEVYAKPEGAESIEGYGTKLQKNVDEKKSWGDHLFHMIWPPSCINYRFWPQNPPFYREANEEYAKYMREVADKLFRYLSLGLGMEGDVVKAAVGGEEVQYLLKINYYPPCPRPDLALGVVAHTDVSSLTLLVPNHVPGLQVLKDDHWIHANYIPNALIVHIGDQIQILSNGKYKSVMHRTTVDKEKARMSWPVFLQPPPEWVVGPLPQLVSEDDPPKYKTNKFKDFMYCKLNKIPL